MISLDELRAAHPGLGFALYAYQPGGPVTLEVHTPDAELYSFTGLSAAQAIEKAFPFEAEVSAQQDDNGLFE